MRRVTRWISILALATAVGGCSETTIAPDAEPDQSPAALDRAVPIPGQYIVRFRASVDDPAVVTTELAQVHRLQIRHRYQHTIKGFAAVIPPGALAALEAHPAVLSIEQDRYIQVHPVMAATAPRPAVAPTPPSNMVATAFSSSQVDLTWQDNSVDEDEFQIARSIGPAGPWTTLYAIVGPNVTAFSDTDLDPETEYCYAVAAANEDGPSFHSNIDCATTLSAPPTPPAAPSGLVASTVDDQSINVTWSDNAGNEDGYTVRRRLGQTGAFADVATLGPNATSFLDVGLPSSTEFCYQVIAFNGAGDSPASNVDCATTAAPPPSPPAAPSGLVATTVDAQSLSITWIDNATTEDGFTLRRRQGQTGAFTDIATLPPNTVSYVDVPLPSGTEFCYEVVAFNAGGNSAGSNIDCATTDAAPAPGPPAPPSNMVATAISDQQIDLVWQDNSNNEDEFLIARRVGPGGPWTTVYASVGANVTTYSDLGLDPDTEYCYGVAASNADGPSIHSNIACATTLAATPTPPAAPSQLVTTSVNAQTINLAWLDNANNEDGFRILRRLGQTGSFSEIGQTGPNVVSFLDTGRDPETEYCYQVLAFNASGDSPASNVDCATTPAPGLCTDTGNHDDLAQLWNITRVAADQNPTWQATQQEGCEITVDFYGLDTGVDSDHPDLNVVEIQNFVASEPARTGEDGNGHGTHTAGTVAAVDGNGGVVGVAPGAPIHGFRVCDDGGSCAISDIIAGVDEVTSRKLANPGRPAVANVSLGGGTSNSMDTAIRESINAGVVYAISAGNGAFGSCTFPFDAQLVSPARIGDDDINGANGSDGDTRRLNGAITTTSSNQSDADDDCNYGNPVSVAAPGVGVLSTYLNGGFAFSSGTSMAAPHSAGAAILYLHNDPSATPTEVEQAIAALLDPWTTDDTPNATGRLNVSGL